MDQAFLQELLSGGSGLSLASALSGLQGPIVPLSGGQFGPFGFSPFGGEANILGGGGGFGGGAGPLGPTPIGPGAAEPSLGAQIGLGALGGGTGFLGGQGFGGDEGGPSPTVPSATGGTAGDQLGTLLKTLGLGKQGIDLYRQLFGATAPGTELGGTQFGQSLGSPESLSALTGTMDPSAFLAGAGFGDIGPAGLASLGQQFPQYASALGFPEAGPSLGNFAGQFAASNADLLSGAAGGLAGAGGATAGIPASYAAALDLAYGGAGAGAAAGGFGGATGAAAGGLGSAAGYALPALGAATGLGMGAYNLAQGNTGAGIGGLVGTGAGALGGAAIGSAVPGIGTLLGALIGAGIGGSGGGMLGGLFGKADVPHEVREARELQRHAGQAQGFASEIQGATDLDQLYQTLLQHQTGYVGGTAPQAVDVGFPERNYLGLYNLEPNQPGGPIRSDPWTQAQFFQAVRERPGELQAGIQAGVRPDMLTGMNVSLADLIRGQVSRLTPPPPPPQLPPLPPQAQVPAGVGGIQGAGANPLMLPWMEGMWQDPSLWQEYLRRYAGAG